MAIDPVSLAQSFRARVVERDAETLARITASYNLAWGRIASDLDALVSRIESARAAGESVNASWLFREARYRALLNQLTGRLAEWGADTSGLIARRQEDAALSGADAARLLTLGALSDEPARAAEVVTSFSRLSESAIQNLVGVLGDGSPLSSLLSDMASGAAVSVRDILIAGVARGTNPRVLAVEMSAAGKDICLSRSLRIARTEVLRAYRQANLDTLRENADVVSGWVWTASLSDRTCPMCLAMHDTIHPLSEPFGSHPNCRCVPRPYLPDVPIDGQSGEEWLRSQDEATQKQILGPGALAAWMAGKITLSDLVHEEFSESWGLTRRTGSLADALAKR